MKESNVERTHDKLYLVGERRDKEYFKLVWDAIRQDYDNKNITLLDIGCATGDFIWFSRNVFPEICFSGLDIMPELLERIHKDMGDEVKTFSADISNINTLPKNIQFDCVTMLGVMSIFDDFRKILDNVLELLKSNGHLYLFGIFNPEDIDVFVKSKPSQVLYEDAVFECGWNVFSKKSISMYCDDRNLKCSFLPFNLGIDIEKTPNDPLRSWTIDINGKRGIINGLQIIHHFYLCNISRN